MTSKGKTPSTRLPEYDVRLAPAALSDSLPPHDARTPATRDKVTTSTAQCYIPCLPNQNFRVMVSNYSGDDACITLLVDGEWIYSGLSYKPEHKTIHFSGKLIDETTIQEMKFIDLDTTCTPPRARNVANVLRRRRRGERKEGTGNDYC